MHLDENITTFDQAGQQAITHLFSHLQDAHNHMSQVAAAVVQLSKVSSTEQFTFVLKIAVRPIIQLKIPPHLLAPTDLKFEKERLTQEETVEEYCCNLLLPRPFHPKLSGIPLEHPTRCLAAAAHFLIRKKLFNSKNPQLQVAKDFAVAEKKLHLTASGRKYDPGKKAHHERSTSGDATTPSKTSTPEKQQPTQSDTITGTQQEHQPSEFSSDDDETLPDLFSFAKTFETKDPKSIPNQNLVQVKSNLCIHKSNFFQPDINLLYLLLFFTGICRKPRHKQGNSFPYVHSKIHLVPNMPKFFKIS